MDLSVDFFGLKLKNPIIVASCPIGETFEKMYDAYLNGAAAIITKTCTNDVDKEGSQRRCLLNERGFWLTSSFKSEIMDIKDLIKIYEKSVKMMNIPIIPSVTTKSNNFKSWEYLCDKFIRLGAKIIQLDFFYIKNVTYQHYSEYVSSLLNYLKSKFNVTFFPKINFNMGKEIIIEALKKAEIQYVSLLDSIKMPAPIDLFKRKNQINNITNLSSVSLYGGWQYPITMNYVFDFYKKGFRICGGGGVDNYEKVLELLCYGATTVQIATHFLIKGTSRIKQILEDVKKYLEINDYNSLQEFISRNRIQFDGKKQSVDVIINFEKNKCIKCLKCVKQNFCNVFDFINGNVTVDQSKCFGCSLCTYLCDTGALETKPIKK